MREEEKREREEERGQMDKEGSRSGAKSRTKRSCTLNGCYVRLEARGKDMKLSP